MGKHVLLSYILFSSLVTKTYSYFNNWFPVVSISSHDFSNPQKVKILNNDFVVWKKEGKYVVQNDLCPHKCAPLSEGYIDKNTKNLRCSYHGWEFDECGTCQSIPQLETPLYNEKNYKKYDELIERRERKLDLGNIDSYPTYDYGDLLWVYLGTDNADHTPCDLYNIDDHTTFVRDLPLSVYTVLENFMDPAHIPIAHHKLQSTRDKARPLKIDVLTDVLRDKNRISIKFTDVNEKKNLVYRQGIMDFQYPHYWRASLLKPRNNFIRSLHIFAIPVSEKKTRIFLKSSFNVNSDKYFWYINSPKWLQHAFINRFLDSDTFLLYKQEDTLRNNNKNVSMGSWNITSDYYLPSRSDKSTTFFRLWLNRFMPTIPFLSSQDNDGGELSREQVLDRYEQHVSHCKYCKNALKTTKLVQMIMITVFGSLFVMGKNPLFLLMCVIVKNITQFIEKQFYYNDYIHNKIS